MKTNSASKILPQRSTAARNWRKSKGIEEVEACAWEEWAAAHPDIVFGYDRLAPWPVSAKVPPENGSAGNDGFSAGGDRT